ncbi:MAG TPA: hypothetical protein VMG81_08045 [Thermoplasmata archaeon]|nr:hypothetical protein [Thermoplasmata archaeon]
MAPTEPPEVQSIKSMLHIVRILAIIFGILLLLAGLAYVAFVVYVFSVCGSIGSVYCGGVEAYALVFPILILIWGVVDFVIYVQMKEIEALVNQHQFEAAKSKTLIWMILGFIIGGILVGVLLLIAYLKFDPVINWSRSQGGMAPGMAYAPPPAGYPQAPPPAAPPPAAAPMAAPPPPPAPAAPPAPMCPKCGRPTTYIAQYGRYYCYTDQVYV